MAGLSGPAVGAGRDTVSRIVAGRFGGRRLTVPAGRGTRPTSDRVREALFARLDHLDAIASARVLDLFAGSGALGLEAVSRGAGSAVLVDSDRAAAAACRRNVADLGLDSSVSVAARTAAAYLGAEPDEFDLVLLDPPYDLAEPALAGLLARLAEGWLAERALVVVERSRRSAEPNWPAGLLRLDERRYGETTVWLAEPAQV